MLYVSKQKEKENLRIFTERNGRIDKLLDEDGTVIGYLVRAEANSRPGRKDVVVTFSFNVNYRYRKSAVGAPLKFFYEKDLKNFAIMHNLEIGDKLIKTVGESERFLALKYDSADEEIFEKNLKYIANGNIQYLKQTVDCVRHEYPHPAVLKSLPVITDDYTQMKEYIINCIKNIKKYYKNDEFCLYFE